MSLIVDNYENNFQKIFISYNILLNRLKKHDDYKEKHYNMFKIIENNINELELNLDILSLMLDDDDYELNEKHHKKLEEIDHQNKVFKKLYPYLILINEAVRTDSK